MPGTKYSLLETYSSVAQRVTWKSCFGILSWISRFSYAKKVFGMKSCTSKLGWSVFLARERPPCWFLFRSSCSLLCFIPSASGVVLVFVVALALSTLWVSKRNNKDSNDSTVATAEQHRPSTNKVKQQTDMHQTEKTYTAIARFLTLTMHNNETINHHNENSTCTFIYIYKAASQHHQSSTLQETTRAPTSITTGTTLEQGTTQSVLPASARGFNHATAPQLQDSRRLQHQY